jgi:poly(ADP-ribose) glycohydrolase ARH3
MRVAPVGLRFHGDPEALVEQARRSAAPTHAHPLGVEGAVLLAGAAGLLVEAEAFDREAFFDELARLPLSDPYREKLAIARAVDASGLGVLGNGIEALESVPTAVACFACSPDSYPEAVASAILLGGDTDTIAAMAGALSGAYLGEGAIPTEWLDALEDEPESKGRSAITRLAESLDARAGSPG